MKLTPLDVRKQEFKKAMRGFDADEVEAFLTMVADELELHIREKNQLNDELIKLRTQLRDYQRVETTLRETLVKAQNTIEDTRANSRREAELIIHEAELQADNIIKDAREQLLGIRHEISLLKSQKDAIAKRLRYMLESQLEMLDVMVIDDLDSKKAKTDKSWQRKEQGYYSDQNEVESSENEHRPRIIRHDSVDYQDDDIENTDSNEEEKPGTAQNSFHSPEN